MTTEFPWKRILAPIDFSPPAEAALVYALKLAQATSAEMYVVHIIPVPHILDAFYERGLTPPENVKQISQRARRRIREIIQTTGNTSSIRLRFQEGEAAALILEQAAKLKVDLIVMGTHGRSGATRFLLGSVAEAVVRRASCPVLTLRT
jgi:nucleotide-binding universal stress UspA family protein